MTWISCDDWSFQKGIFDEVSKWRIPYREFCNVLFRPLKASYRENMESIDGTEFLESTILLVSHNPEAFTFYIVRAIVQRIENLLF